MRSSPRRGSRWPGSRRPPAGSAIHGVAMTGIFLSVSRVLPDLYPLEGELDDYIADEHTVGRLLDLGVIVPRLAELYRWSADELRIPDVADLVRDATPAYAWDPRTPNPGATADAARPRRAPGTSATPPRSSVDKRQISTRLATRVVNPVVRWAVRHGLAPRSYAILETTGRRSGSRAGHRSATSSTTTRSGSSPSTVPGRATSATSARTRASASSCATAGAAGPRASSTTTIRERACAGWDCGSTRSSYA